MPDTKTTIEIEGKDSSASKALDEISARLKQVDADAAKAAGSIARSARIVDTTIVYGPHLSPEMVAARRKAAMDSVSGGRGVGGAGTPPGGSPPDPSNPNSAENIAKRKARLAAQIAGTEAAERAAKETEKQEGFLKRIRVSLNAMAARFAGASPLSPVISTAQSALGVGGRMGIGLAGGAIAGAAIFGIAQQIHAQDIAHEHVMHNIDIERRAMAGANEQARLAHVNKLANAIEEKRIDQDNEWFPNLRQVGHNAEERVNQQVEQIKNATEAIRLGKESVEIARLESIGADYAADKLRRKMEVARQIAEIQNNAGLNPDQKKELTAQAREMDRLQHLIPPQIGIGDSLTQAGGGGGVFLPSGADSALPADPAMDKNNELLNNIEAAINALTAGMREGGFNMPTIRINRN